MKQPEVLAQESRDAFREASATADQGEKEHLLREAQNLAGHSALADAYAFLQKVVGLIAVTLPLVVAVGNELLGDGRLQSSISKYYYTHLGNYFVGSLCAIGVLLLSYQYKPLPKYRIDNVLANVACVMAVGVALFPTASDAEEASGGASVVSTMHLVFAGVLFSLLAVFSLLLFTKSDEAGELPPAKKRRNLVHRACGVVIVVAMVLVGVRQVVDVPRSWYSFFWLESIAVVAFGFSWLVKGGFLGWWADPPPDGS